MVLCKGGTKGSKGRGRVELREIGSFTVTTRVIQSRDGLEGCRIRVGDGQRLTTGSRIGVIVVFYHCCLSQSKNHEMVHRLSTDASDGLVHCAQGERVFGTFFFLGRLAGFSLLGLVFMCV